MKENALQQYTKQKKLYGQNQQQILDKFVQYASSVSDPMNIYKYMEQKSICIYLANYWIHRANLFSQTGDFRDALLCLKQAKSRNHIVKQNQVKFDDHLEKIKRKMVTSMKRYPPKTKRSGIQYSFIYQNDKKTTFQLLESLVQIYEKNYKNAKRQIQKEFQLKIHGKLKSWLAPIEQQNQQNMKKLSQKIKSLNNQQTFMSMRTPISKKDPMRLTKTMDSVQMLKKKKSTQQKNNKKLKLGQNSSKQINVNRNGNGNMEQKQQYQADNQQQSDDQQDDNRICMNTTPVGVQLKLLSRRVTFNKEMGKYCRIQKIRSNLLGQKSSKSRSKSKSKQRSDQENKDKDRGDLSGSCNKNQSHIDKSKSISKRGSILKNKKITQEYLDMEDQK